MLHPVATLALGPLLYAQGTWVRRRTPELPEPPGPRAGSAGEGPLLRLLVAGDSAAAGVGAASQHEALSGRLVDALQTTSRVSWRLEASTGATTRDTVERLAALRGRFDVLVTSLGVNDVTGGTSQRAWLEGQRALRELARTQLGVTLLVIASPPPMGAFPALPQPLRWYLGQRARTLGRRLRHDLRDEPSARFLEMPAQFDPADMARDGFHPGPAIYRAWARRAAEVIRTHWRPPRAC